MSFNTHELRGILVSIAKPEIHIGRSDSIQIGYRVRVRVNIRGSDNFLIWIERALLMKGIESKYKKIEHKSRPRPILTISGLVNLWKLSELIPKNMPDAKNTWGDFREVITLMDEGKHHTLEGLERILQIKGEL